MKRVVFSYFIIILLMVGTTWGEPSKWKILPVDAPTSVAMRAVHRLNRVTRMFAVSQAERGQVSWWTGSRWISLKFARPIGVGIDERGNLWVGDDAKNSVCVVGLFRTNLSRTCYQDDRFFDRPSDFAFLGEWIFIVDNGKGTVLVMDPRRRIRRLVTGLVNPTGVAVVVPASLRSRRGVRGDWPLLATVELYVLDQEKPSWFGKNEPVVRKYLTDLRSATVQLEYGKSYLEFPMDVGFYPEGTLLVLDNHLAEVLRFDLQTGGALTSLGSYGVPPDGWRNPSDMTVQDACATVADSGNNRVVFMPLIAKDCWAPTPAGFPGSAQGTGRAPVESRKRTSR